MGLVGDGSIGIQKVGRDALPHMARTFAAQMDQASVQNMSYNDELLQNNPGMDSARAQQLENWATQNEIAMSNTGTRMEIRTTKTTTLPSTNTVMITRASRIRLKLEANRQEWSL